MVQLRHIGAMGVAHRQGVASAESTSLRAVKAFMFRQENIRADLVGAAPCTNKQAPHGVKRKGRPARQVSFSALSLGTLSNGVPAAHVVRPVGKG